MVCGLRDELSSSAQRFDRGPDAGRASLGAVESEVNAAAVGQWDDHHKEFESLVLRAQAALRSATRKRRAA